ncbi:MAG: LysR family transcriptional regulator [Limimaricola sp.]|nr:LysR family transcriptional regulator [Limimaricola sp.]
MRLEWLEDILAVAETGSFSEAAERRHLTPSAFSRRIQHIEDQVGVELFDRTRKPVQLLTHTAAQRDQIAMLARQLRQLGAELRRGDHMSANNLVISSQHSLTTSLTPSIIKNLNRDRGDIYIRLRSANLAECFSQLLSRQADILIVYRLRETEHPILGSYIESITMGVEALIPVLAPDALANLVTGPDATVVPYVAYPAEVFLGQVLERSVMPRVRSAIEAAPRAETALTLAALELATMGIGVAWVPQSLAQERISAGKLVNLSDFLPSCSLEVTAVRLVGNPRPVEVAVWERLSHYRLSEIAAGVTPA